ncbi:ABC transporter substrate-binding protein [Robertmurraya yapensis]|uniref:ABC transporter substrate-binding protein n=2 Tax=Bacillus yapensis TaxID=2492960 RepID=A0A3S0ICH2_9BACI|nr:zinc ABC transporter substrate-binding protein [Bacillus yapensis]RTR30508.1 ABC transporter substrate-binding protein [Bacillus yapensis]TKS95327.1 ABC transporter substrate-binding protein [Bacillus yapensis]
MKLKSIYFVLMLAVAAFLGGCSSNASGEKETEINTNVQLTVYTTIFPLENFARLIGGDKVNVKSVYPPNVDAHTFEPTTKTMVDIAGADLFIYTGAGVEGFADKAVEALKDENVEIIKAADGIELLKSSHDHEHEHAEGEEAHDHGHVEDEEAHDHEHVEGEETHDHEHTEGEEAHDHEHTEGEEAHDHEHTEGEEDHDHEHTEGGDGHNHGEYDPHVWLDPIRAIQLAENIKNALVELSPENKELFESNFEDLQKNLEGLDQEFADTVNQASTKEILVSHAAYGYWAERYGIEQLSISGLSPTQEPSQSQLKAIVEESKEHNLKYVIFDQNVTSKVAEIIQKEIGAEPQTLHNLESVTDEDIKNNQDYFTIMKKNIDTLRKVLNN